MEQIQLEAMMGTVPPPNPTSIIELDAHGGFGIAGVCLTLIVLIACFVMATKKKRH